MGEVNWSDPAAWLSWLDANPKHDRREDEMIALSLGWRVSHDPWWNWHPGPRFDPPGDAYCIRRDGRNDRPCDEALPVFTAASLQQILAERHHD